MIKSIKINFNRVSFIRFAVVLFLSTFGVSEIWSAKDYKSTLTVSVKTGAGTVYVGKSTSYEGGNSTSSKAYTQTTNGTSAATHTFCINAVPDTDYRFDGWTFGGTWSTQPTATAAATNGKMSSGTTAVTATAQASFLQISIASVSPATVTLNPTDARTSCSDYTGSVVFTTTNDNATTQIGAPTISNSGSGSWNASNSWTAGKSTVTYTFKGNGYYGGSGTASGSRSNSATLTLPTAGGTSSKSVTFTANFPSLVLYDATDNNTAYPISPTADGTGYVEFPVKYCDGAFDFTATITGASGGTFTSGTIEFTLTDAATGSGNIKVPFTFNAGGATGNFSATLTLTPQANTGGSAKTVTIGAYAEAEATNDVSVTTSAGVTTEYATFAAGLTAANKANGNTLKLLRNVDLGSISATNTISKTMTIDLNGKTLQATVTKAIPLLTISATTTITDSKTGGMIYSTGAINGVVYGVTVSAAKTLTVSGGTIKAENTQQYFYGTSSVGGTETNKASVGARGIQQTATATVNITGGTIQGIASRNAFGIREEGSVANNTTLNISGGEIYAEAASYAYGVYGLGKVNISGGTITSQINTNTVNGNETYTNYRINTSKALDGYTVNGYGYGVCVTASANTKAANCYFSTLNITGGTINSYDASTCMVGTSAQGQNVYGVYMGAASYIKGSNTTPDGTLTQKASAIGQISGATINVDNKGATSYGVIVGGSYNSFDNTESIVKISNCDISVTSYSNSYGVYASASIGTSSSTYGACYAGKVMLENNNVTTSTTTAATSVALYATGTMTTIKTATNATYAGEYESSAYMYVKSGTYTANSKTSYATAAITGPWTSSNAQRGNFKTNFAVDGSLGGNVESMSAMYISGGTFKATSGTTHARGVWNSGSMIITGGTFEAEATTTNAYGIYANRGIVQATGATFKATAGTGTAYGAYSDAMINDYVGWKYAGTLNLTNCSLTATTNSGNTAYGAYINGTTRTISTVNSSYKTIGDVVLGGYAVVGNADIKGCTINATAAGTTAGGIYRVNTQVSADNNDIAQGEFSAIGNTIIAKTNGTTTAYGIRAGGPSIIKDNNITVTTTTTGSTGIIVGEGSHTVTGNTVTAKGTATVYGLQMYTAVNSTTGYLFQGNATLEDNTISATTTTGNTAYAVYLTDAKLNIASGTFAGDYVAASSAVINSGKYTATAAGTTGYALVLDATKTQGAVSGSASCTVNGGKFKGTATSTFAGVNASATADNLSLAGGYYVVNTNLNNYVADGYMVSSLTSGDAYTEGYRYQISNTSSGVVCKVYSGSTLKGSYQTLEEALQYVNQNSTTALTIVMVDNYSLTAGDYTLPAKATLLVPYKSGQTAAIGTSASVVQDRTAPTQYMQLVFASGVNLTVKGILEVSAQEASTNGGNATGCTTGPYGRLILREGAHIDLESGSKLQCWGYITGDGTISAKSGAYTYEHFEIAANKGGSIMSDMVNNDQKVFPIDDYFLQNIESEITYYQGAFALASSALSIPSGSKNTINGIKIIGNTDDYLFKMSTDGSRPDMFVRKKYEPQTDRCVWTLNDGAQLSSLKVKIYIQVNANAYVLPISSAMDIVMNYGTLSIVSGQDVLMAPGSRMIIKKNAKFQVPSGVNFYVYDVAQWEKGSPKKQYAYTSSYQPDRPSTNPRAGILTNKTNLPSAEIFVQGKLEVLGSLQTTAGKANIHSTNEDAGEVIFNNAATASGTVYQYTSSGASTYNPSSTTSAQLKNGDGSYVSTVGASAGDTYIYKNNVWVKVSTDGCFKVETISGTSHYYAHPADWVEVTANTPDDHAYHVSADPTRFVIQGADCEWIEVEKDGDYYKCINENSIYYGSYFEWSDANNYWVEKLVTVNFNNQGTITTYNNIPYNSIPYFLGSAPSKTSSSSDYYYTWTGWDTSSSNSGDAEYGKNKGDLPVATADVTYYAHFDQTYYQYTITFANAKNGESVAALCNSGSMPVCPIEPVKTSTTQYYYEFSSWNPALATVTGTATYTAQFNQINRPYTITFYNYDGTLLQQTEVAYGSTPAYSGTPTRDADAFYSYVFDSWSPAVSAVTGDASYYATFNSVARSYSLTWDANGGVLSGTYTYGDMQVGATITPPTATREGYTFTGWSPSTVETTMPAEDLTYTAQWQINTYTVTLAVNPSGAGTLTSTSITNVPHNSTITIVNNKITINGTTVTATPAANTAQYTYSFSQWSNVPAKITSAVTITAEFTCTTNSYTITWKDSDGTVLETDENVEYGTTPSYDGATPTKTADENYVYTFAGWTPTVEAVTGNATYTATYSTTPTVASVAVDGTTTYHATIADAITTANGKTDAVVTMLQNASVTEQVEIISAMTIDLNGKTVSSTLASATGVFKIVTSAKATIVTIKDSGIGGKIDHSASFKGYLYGVWLNTGTLNIESGTISANNPQAASGTSYRAYGINADGANTASALNISGGTIEAASPAAPFGIYVSSTCPLTMTGGTITASGNNTPRGIYVKGTTTLDNATITSTATGANSYTIFAKAGTLTINSGTYTATGTGTVYTIHEEAGTVAINGGKFSGTNKVFDKSGGTATVKGGVYTNNADLEANCATNYHALSLTSGDDYEAGYRYKIAEAYQVSFDVQGHGSQPETQLIEKGSGATEPATPAVDNYTFGGWFKEPECTNKWNFTTDVVTAETILYAQWNASEVGIELDIVDWDGTSAVVINMNGYFSTECGSYPDTWQITINDITKTYTNADMDGTRRVTLDLSSLNLQPGDQVTIKLINGCGNVESQHTYQVPFNYNTDEEVDLSSEVTEDSNIQIRKGSVRASITVKAKSIVVHPGVRLIVLPGVKLTVEKELVVRTTEYLAGEIINYGTIEFSEGAKMYYTRICTDNEYHQFALPFAADLTKVTSSRYADVYGTRKAAVLAASFSLTDYNGERRATQNTGNGNWRDLNRTYTTLEAGKGYLLRSASKYYYEYYFPVTYSNVGTDAKVAVHTYEGDAKTAEYNKNWNFIASPYTYTYTYSFTDPATAYKLCYLMPSGQYWQDIFTMITPARPFFYQPENDGYLQFNTSGLANMAARSAESEVQTQWLRLVYGNVQTNTDDCDPTSIYLHPTRFTTSYDRRYETMKQSTSGSTPVIYSSLEYGDLAFAAVPDNVAEQQRIPLTVYQPAAGMMRISLTDNDFLTRLDNVFLYDDAYGRIVDLLVKDYTFDAQAGTISNRFFLQPRFVNKLPQVTTDITNADAETLSAYTIGHSIVVSGAQAGETVYCYDAVGRLIGKEQATVEYLMQFSVPADGMYIIKTESKLIKVVVK